MPHHGKNDNSNNKGFLNGWALKNLLKCSEKVCFPKYCDKFLETASDLSSGALLSGGGSGGFDAACWRLTKAGEVKGRGWLG